MKKKNKKKQDDDMFLYYTIFLKGADLCTLTYQNKSM